MLLQTATHIELKKSKIEIEVIVVECFVEDRFESFLYFSGFVCCDDLYTT